MKDKLERFEMLYYGIGLGVFLGAVYIIRGQPDLWLIVLGVCFAAALIAGQCSIGQK